MKSLAIVCVLSFCLSAPLPASQASDVFDPYFTRLKPNETSICGLSRVTAATLFTPRDEIEIYTASDAAGRLCAEVYSGLFYRGTLRMEASRKSAVWSSSDGTRTIYDMTVSEQARDVAARHSLRSLSLSALLHWEAEESAGATVIEKVTGCWANSDACTSSADHCAGTSIVLACQNHDWCYQCGYTQGLTRADCDVQLFDDIYALTGNGNCASAYYWGVRALGFLFFQDPNYPINRLHYWGDVYSLGISMNACSGTQYERMCTTYYF